MLAVIILVLVASITYAIARGVLRPLNALVARMEDIADGDGDLTHRMDDTGADEYGRLAHSFNRFVTKMNTTIREIGTTSQTLSASAEEFTAISRQLASNAEATSRQASSVSDASSEINVNVQSVAAAAEQMSASIKEISKNTTEAERVARDICASRGHPVSRNAVHFVLAGYRYSGFDWTVDSLDGPALAREFADNVLRLAAGAQMALTDAELEQVRAWICGADGSRAAEPDQ
jgi:HAMP domain-containing protein